MPVGTAAAMKAMTPAQLWESGAQIVLANAYHLANQPGTKLIEKMGGLHQFMGWPNPLLTDCSVPEVTGCSAPEVSTGLDGTKIDPLTSAVPSEYSVLALVETTCPWESTVMDPLTLSTTRPASAGSVRK